jgi:hypothetical protein
VASESPDDANENASEGAPHAPSPPLRRFGGTPRRRGASLAFLVFGLLVALYLGTQRAQEQHVRIVLGAAAAAVTGVDLSYLAHDGEPAREAHFTYREGAAPRIVAHEPKLPNGDYRLEINVDTRDGRRALQRQVTLGGGSTQIDIASALAREPKPDGTL